MIVAIIGSRGISDEIGARVERYVRSLPANDIVITGDASGVDAYARSASEQARICIIVRPAWERDGKAAGPIRNREIAGICDRMVAYWDGRSRGTFSAINFARAMNKDVEVVRI